MISIVFLACQAQENQNKTENKPIIHHNEDSLAVIAFEQEHKQINQISQQLGTVSNGSLVHGKILPFYGENFRYFDYKSYLASRAFTSDIVRKIILNSYKKLYEFLPNRFLYLMELSNKNGGEIYPHRTHQNGLSVDFMMPKLKKGTPYYGLDTLGARHYLLKFNNKGQYTKDKEVQIDFNLIAQHLLILNEEAKKMNYKIEKVIIKVELKNLLYATDYGKKLRESDIYLVQNLSPLINGLHDEHYHVDFRKN
ncbi:hypothetical protein CW751_11655 [Brumimicrobium salinarum]|uniref:Replication initiation protein n=2 Tax=Brumimicrobium salinarum TaxID=2058658 RepID=A0A2I0R0N9_9FLAO|nr:hypothetical protein CW751_11655 [Brumimicrobium salinarum]